MQSQTTDDVFNICPPCARNAVHAAMRHCWFDMIDVWNFSDEDKENFAIRGSHWDYFQHLLSLKPSLAHNINSFFDHAAQNGEIELLVRLPRSITGSKAAMDGAARKGHLNVVQWLHTNRTIGCTSLAMYSAAVHGHLQVVQFLRKNRNEGNIRNAIDRARREGHVHIAQYLEGTINIFDHCVDSFHNIRCIYKADCFCK